MDLDPGYDAIKYRCAVREFIAYALIKSRVCKTTMGSNISLRDDERIVYHLNSWVSEKMESFCRVLIKKRYNFVARMLPFPFNIIF